VLEHAARAAQDTRRRPRGGRSRLRRGEPHMRVRGRGDGLEPRPAGEAGRVSAGVLLGIGLLGGMGAPGRFLLDAAVSARAQGRFPWGTLAGSLSGAFALGALVGAGVSADVMRLAAIGLLGGFTTFSTWMFESHRLAEDGEGRLGAVNLLASLVLGL